MLEAVFSTLAAMSLTGSALWLALCLARPLTGRLCSARWEKASRGAVLAAYLLPAGLLLRPLLRPAPTLTVPASLSPFASAVSLPPIWALTSQDAKPGPPLPVMAVLAGIWLAGAVVLGLWLLLRQRRFTARLGRTARPVEDGDALALLAALARELGVSPAPALYLSPAVGSPMGVGVLRPVLYLPDLNIDAQELELILRHELVHLRRRDLWLKWAALAALLLHWFDPFAWRFVREVGLLCETACDEAVAGRLDAQGRRVYGHAILNALSRTVPTDQGVCSSFSTGSAGLKRRLGRLAKPHRGRAGQWLCTGAAALLLLGALPAASALHAWAEPYGGWGDAWSYEANLARSALDYLELGITYDAARDLFFYRGQPLSLFADILDVTPEQRAQGSDFDHIWKCCWFNQGDRSGPAYRTVRDGAQNLVGLRLLSTAEADALFAANESSVCFNSYTTSGDGRFYASDPAWESLPREIRDWAAAVPAGETAVLEQGTEGYVCYGGVYCPWTLELDGAGGLIGTFYPKLQCADPSRPCVIRYTALTPPTGFTFHVEAEKPTCD